MSRKKEILTAVGTLGCAVAIGFVMQQSESAHELYGTGTVRDTLRSIEKTASADKNVLSVQAITLTSAEYDTSITLPQPEEKVTTIAAPQNNLPLLTGPTAVPEMACDILLTARPVAAAMVNLNLTAPCLPNERVSLHHNGMVFTEVTGADGSLDLTVPALVRDAVFVVAFSNGEGSVAQTSVDELADFDRVALQWKGQTGFQVHAREFGADYGDPGHVWSGAARDIVAAASGRGGFLTHHGNPEVQEALLAEVYTFPSGTILQAGGVALSVEAEVSAANCGLEIEAQTLQVTKGGKLESRDLTLAVPDCDAIGSFLVLNNLFQDLKVAGN